MEGEIKVGDIRQAEQLETCCEPVVALPAKKKDGRGRPFGSWTYEIPGKGKVPIQEYKAWQRAKKKAEKLAANMNNSVKPTA